MSNIPIRLVHQNGDITELMATDVALDVERKTGGMAMPLSGSTRLGFDLNMNNATIIINGIITDDTFVNTNASALASYATVDFSISFKSGSESTTAAESWLTGGGEQVEYSSGLYATTTTVENAIAGIRLNDTDGNYHVIHFVSHSTALDNIRGQDTGSSLPSNEQYYIGIYRTDTNAYGTAAQVADNFCDVINNHLSSKFVAELQTSSFTNEANTQVKITQVTAGDDGDTRTPVSLPSFNNTAKIPYMATFRGGRGSTDGAKQLSAGDKVMNLFGILNNSQNKRTVSVGNLIEKFSENKRYGDYIIAIQIPYNSKFHGGGSTGLEYSARNFFMPTGGTTTVSEKSTENSEPASTEFSEESRWNTGIKGSVQKATFTQLGGEPIYSFTIVFAPIDKIW